MNSRVVTYGDNTKASHLVTAIEQVIGTIDTEIKGQYGHTVIIKTGDVTINNNELDCEFYIPFDDDTEANEAEITVYNLSQTTIKNIKRNAKITVTAGYGKDTGVIFSGFISSIKTYHDGCDKVTKVYALDDMNLKERDVTSVSYAAGTKASKILRDLVKKVGLPVAVFEVKRDYTYTNEETIDGGLMSNIERLAGICGVSAYILKSKIYVRPLNKGDNTNFELSVDTGLIDYEEFEEKETNGDYKDTIKGYKVTMLLQHQVQTASIFKIKAKDVSGTYRVMSGSHEYNGDEFVTKAKVVDKIEYGK